MREARKIRIFPALTSADATSILTLLAGIEAYDEIYFRSIPVHYVTPKNHRRRPIGGNITDHMATSVIVVIFVVVVRDIIFRPAGDVSGVARQRGRVGNVGKCS